MKTRPITDLEYKKFARLYKSMYGYRNERFFRYILIGIVFFALFLYMYFRFSIKEAFNGTFAFIALFIVTYPWHVGHWTQMRRDKNYLSFRKDLKEKIVSIGSAKIVKVFKIFDPSYNGENESDFLFLTEGDKWICIPFEDIKLSGGLIRNILNINSLKNSGAFVSLSFSGDEMEVSDKIIHADGEWRCDDLPFYEFFDKSLFSKGIKNQLF